MNRQDDSVPQVRRLTAGEVRLAASVFGTALDASRVRVRRCKWWAWQPWWVTMAPDGDIWCHPNGPNWCADYAQASIGYQAHFIHELVHVWQYQVGGHLALRRPPWARYRYAITPGKPFIRYGIEQQACIVEDAFRARSHGRAVPELEALLPFGG